MSKFSIFFTYNCPVNIGPDGKTRLMTTPKTIITDTNVMNQNSMKIQSTNSQIVTRKFE